MEIVSTYFVNIYVGLREEYSDKISNIQYAIKLIQDFVNERKLGVTVTETNFLYVDGNEPGLIVGLINYPRFPDTQENIKNKAIDLAKILLVKLKQNRISLVTPNETIMIDIKDIY